MTTQDDTRDPPDQRTVIRPGDATDPGSHDGAGRTSDPQAVLGTRAQTPDEVASASISAGEVPAVPGYEIVGELGRGGMGVVYRARDTRLNRVVALKMIHRADASRVTVARFWAEAEVMAAVKHPHVAQVYELGEHDGRPFMALEFVSGGSLEERLEGGPFAPREAAALLAKIASGVAAAHELGVVHRDLKPGNVLLAADGTPKVTDFGIAKRQSHALTQTQALMGTPAYMAPEQAAAKAKFVGPPADVWSLGVILYECLAGKRPFAGDGIESVFGLILFTEPAALRTVARSVPRDLETIVTKCLSKEPEHRYATAGELAADLERFVRGEPIAVRPVGPVERFARWVRRKPTAAAAYGFSALAVLLAVVVLVVLGFWRDAEGARDTAEAAKKDADAARDEAERQRGAADAGRVAEVRLRGLADTARNEALRLKGVADAGRVEEERLRAIADKARETAVATEERETEIRKEVERAKAELAAVEYGRTIQVAHQEWRDNNIVGARALLDGTSPKLRGWEWQYVHRLCNSSLVTLRGHLSPVASASFRPDGARIVTGSEDGTARVWDTKTGAELLTLNGHTSAVESAYYSADGSLILTGSGDKTARVWDAKTGAEVLAFKGHTEWVYGASFSPDGSRVVTGSWDKTARVWDAKTGAELLILKGHEEGLYSACFSADGARVVTASNDKTARVWDAKTGAEILTLKGHTDGVTSAAFDGYGARVVTGSRDKTARLWDTKTGAELLAFKGHTGGVYSVCFSADWARIVTGSGDKTGRVWDAKTGAEILTLKGHIDGVTSAAFSRDGSRVVTGSNDGLARVWDAKTGADVVVSKGRLNWLTPEAFSTHGWRVTVNPDGTVQISDMGTGKRKLQGHTDNVSSASFSADGSRIVTASWDRTAKIWDARTGKELFTLRGHTNRVTSAAFSADGSRIVTTSWDRTAKIWDARIGVELTSLRGHTDIVSSASFSDNGLRVVTGSQDRTARVWDTKAGAELLTLKGHAAAVESVAFGPDGTQVMTGSLDGLTRVWDARSLEREFLPRPSAPPPRPVNH